MVRQVGCSVSTGLGGRCTTRDREASGWGLSTSQKIQLCFCFSLFRKQIRGPRCGILGNAAACENTHIIYGQVCVLAAPPLVWLPANVLDKGAEEGPSVWPLPAT